MNKNTIVAAITVSCFLAITSTPVKAISWNYTATTTGGSAAGKVTTDGTYPARANHTYNISAINGTFTPTGGTSETIIGLNTSYQGPDSTIQWNGTILSTLIVSTAGFSFETANGPYNISNSGPNYYGAATDLYDNLLNDYSVNASSLEPISTSVPFEFSIEQGFILGVPLFLGLRKIKKILNRF